MVANERRRQSLVGDHAVFDDMAEINASCVHCSFKRRRTTATLVRFVDDLLVENAHAADHQQSQIADDQIGECAVIDLIAGDVEAK